MNKQEYRKYLLKLNDKLEVVETLFIFGIFAPPLSLYYNITMNILTYFFEICK